MTSGVYEIVNLVTGKRYVGSAVNFEKRWSIHRCRLSKGQHHSAHLQASWNKHGAQAFIFRRLIVCSREHLLMYEQILLDALTPDYNVCVKAGSPLGVRRSDEHRRKVSESLKGHSFNAGIPKSPEHRAKLSLARRGTPNPKGIGNKSRSGMKTDREIVERQRESLRAAWARRKASGAILRSPEASAQQAATLRETWARKRANANT